MKKFIFAIDPGNEKSAFLIWDHKQQNIKNKDIINNQELLELLELLPEKEEYYLIIEMVACYGMPVGKEIFDTVLWIGQFKQSWGKQQVVLVYRKDIKIHHCNSMKAKDSNIRQALIDRFGDPGVKKMPGLLYGVSKDIWSALAIAVYYSDLINKIE